MDRKKETFGLAQGPGGLPGGGRASAGGVAGNKAFLTFSDKMCSFTTTARKLGIPVFPTSPY